MKRAALYMRVSTVDQHPETQLHDLRQMAPTDFFRVADFAAFVLPKGHCVSIA
jgi:DNA invertase Pin-like site-specific DNA recombinase